MWARLALSVWLVAPGDSTTLVDKAAVADHGLALAWRLLAVIVSTLRVYRSHSREGVRHKAQVV